MRNFHLYFILFLCLTVIKYQVKCILFSIPCRAYALIHYKKEVIYTIYELLLAESRRLEQQISSLQAQLSHYPEGKLLCARNQNRCKWYLSDGHSQKYLPKKERKLAEQLAAKKYHAALLNDLQHEKKAVDLYLKYYPKSRQSEQLLTDTSGFQELLTPYFSPQSQELLNWMNSSYERSTKYPEQLIHKTISGNLVRSKSESLIDMLLYTHKIPFRYECALQLGDITLYPDFTIRHPYTGHIFYWEHFGRMDDSTYCKNTYNKLQLYSSHGIIPSLHLITTYETLEYPLSTDTVEKVIQQYFL